MNDDYYRVGSRWVYSHGEPSRFHRKTCVIVANPGDRLDIMFDDPVLANDYRDGRWSCGREYLIEPDPT